MVTTPTLGDEMHDNDHLSDLEARLRAERPQAPGPLIERISGQVRGSEGHAATRARRAFAVVFASLILSSSVVGIALAGNGGGSNGNGNGDGGHPAACNESAKTHNPHCP